MYQKGTEFNFIFLALLEKHFPNALLLVATVVVDVITPSLPQDGSTARTAIQVYAVNLIEIRLEEKWQPISNQL